MIYKRGSIYWTKFQHQGRVIYKSTGQTSQTKARQVEAKLRSELAMGNFGILSKKAVPTLSDFLRRDFIPYVESKHIAKPGTLEYYRDGANMVLKCEWACERLDQINDQQAQQFAAKFAHLSPSRINCGLRSLRRALNLAYEWGKLDRPARITLAKGERQRDRVLTDVEWQQYITECLQPWRDVATLIRGEGMCPGECFELRWEHVLLNGTGGLIQIAQGKTKARRRMLPMVPTVYEALLSRWGAAGRPTQGWVFPSNSREGHFNKDAAKDQHARALKLSSVRPFEPYCLRHTALTELGQKCDAFTLMRIAGHSSITMTMRYVHPQRDAIALAFAQTQLPRLPSVQHGNVGGVVTKVVTVDVGASAEELQVIGAKGGTRTPTVLPARS